MEAPMKASAKYAGVILLVLLSLTLMSCGGGVAQQEYDDLKAQFDQLSATTHSQLTALQEDLDDAEAELGAAQEDYNDARAGLDAAESEIATLEGTIDSQSAALEEARAEVAELESQLDDVLNTVIAQYYEVSYPPYRYTWDLPVTLRDYFNYKESARAGLGAMVTADDATLQRLATMMRNSSLDDNLKQSDVVNVVAKFTQSLPKTDLDYRKAYDSYPRYPLETLVDQGGDSQDTSILAATLLSLLDFDVVLLGFENDKHMAVGVDLSTSGGKYWEYQGKRYYYIGTTGDYRKLGECPTQYLYLTPDIYVID
jgi:outer membrane murein-binding lipoprotein Lpp